MLARHSATYLAAKLVPGLIEFAALLIYTRLMAPSQFGEYALVMSSVMFAGALVFGWVRAGITRFLSEVDVSRARLVATVRSVVAGLFVVSAVLVFLFLVWYRSTVGTAVVCVAFLYFCTRTAFDFAQEYARADMAPRRYATMALVRTISSASLGLAAVSLGFGPVGLIGALSLGHLVALAAQWRTIPRAPGVGADKELLQQLVRYGLPISASVLLGYVTSVSDRFMLGVLDSSHAVGTYSASYDLVQRTLVTISAAIATAGLPIILRAVTIDVPQAGHRTIKSYTTAVLAVTAPSAVGIGMLADNVSTVLLGSPFRAEAATLLPWVAAGVFLGGVKSHVIDLSFQISRWTTGQVWVSGGAAVTNVLLNLIWIPKWGGLGAAYATAISYLVALGIAAPLARRVLPLPFPWLDATRILTSTGLMALALVPVRGARGPWALLLQVLVGGVTFLASSHLLNVNGVRSGVRSAARYVFRKVGSVDNGD